MAEVDSTPTHNATAGNSPERTTALSRPSSPVKQVLVILLKTLAVFAIGALVVAVALVGRIAWQKMAPSNKPAVQALAKLSLASSAQRVSVGQPFSVYLVADSGENRLSAAKLQIYYPPEYLKLITASHEAAQPNFLPVLLAENKSGTGHVEATLGTRPGESATGTGILYTLTFEPLAATPSDMPIKLSFGPDTKIAAVGARGNIVGKLTPLAITILP